MRPQKARMPQMAGRDRLDAAIDQVAAHMVQVREDEDLAFRIAATLPERSSRFHLRVGRFHLRAPRFGGQVGWLIPQFAAIAAFAIAAIVWTTRDTATPSLLPSCGVAGVSVVPHTVAAVEPGTALRTQPLESAFARRNSGELRRDRPLELLEPVVPVGGADFERSLPAIDAMTALTVSDMAPGELPATPALELAPMVIADLPLTAESFPPR